MHDLYIYIYIYIIMIMSLHIDVRETKQKLDATNITSIKDKHFRVLLLIH